MLICGIDEAGRGPVIGPLVMAGVSILEKDEEKLRALGARDSKTVNKKEREALFKKIISVATNYKIISLTPDVIDDALRKSNLNILEAETTGIIINYLSPEKAYIDLPEKNPERYLSYIRRNLNKENIQLVAEHKADSKYPVVSAASILAKVTRDKYIEFLKETFGEDFGSGYTSDAKTLRFLEKHWDNPKVNFFRKEWVSWKKKREEKNQKRISDF